GFGLSAAKKYGGIYVPANQAVCHQFMREMLASCGSMILGSDSHTHYGCYGPMGIGEGGGELAKQLLENTYDVDAPQVVLVWLEGEPRKGVGPHDVAISLCAEVFGGGLVKNKILEFAGPGVAGLSMDYRIGIDVMTTETSCLSSVWVTDEKVKEYYETVGRPEAYKELKPADCAYYDAIIKVDLSKQECMVALPFHPSNAVTVKELQADPVGVLTRVQEDCNKQLGGQVELKLTDNIIDGKVVADQGVIVGCSGGMYDNLTEAAAILDGQSVGDGYFNLSVYPSSMPIGMAITRDGTAETLMAAGAVIKPAFCGPCFGAGDTPGHNALSIRHATRNFPNREGSKPGEGQISAVALMDARSIAATAANGGVITAATDIEYDIPEKKYVFDPSAYNKRIYVGFGKAQPEAELKFGPNITDWPRFNALGDNLLCKLAAVIFDDVTTTDELIPSGETSSYRSNPIRLSDFALSRRVPEYVPASKAIRAMDEARKLIKATKHQCVKKLDECEAKVAEAEAEYADITEKAASFREMLYTIYSSHISSLEGMDIPAVECRAVRPAPETEHARTTDVGALTEESAEQEHKVCEETVADIRENSPSEETETTPDLDEGATRTEDSDGTDIRAGEDGVDTSADPSAETESVDDAEETKAQPELSPLYRKISDSAFAG
ncbi:MAG: hydratase, partial [Oscillospiraceae bacterium]|nr:hydratase [Oscillospiraceae bacterium]